MIGLAGPNAAGKGEVARILQERGYAYHSLSDGVRVGWMVPELIRQANYERVTLRPEQVRARIDNLKEEVEVLEAELEKLEKQD